MARCFTAEADDGVPLCGRLYGSRNAGDNVLLIMGWSSCLNYWEGQTTGVGNAPALPALADFQLCAFDNRGTGGSGRPWGYYSTTLMAADARAVMRHVGWPAQGRRLHIVGHSLGGMIAQELALLLLDDGVAIETLTLLASHSGGWRMAPPPMSVPRGVAVILSWFFVSKGRVLTLVMPVLHTPQYLVMHPLPHPEEGLTGDDILRPLYHRRAPFRDPLLSYLPGMCGQTFACFTHRVSRARLARIGRGARVLVVAAGADAIIPPAHSMHLARAIGCPYHKLEGSGHMAMTEQPGLFNAFLAAHLHGHLHCHAAGRAAGWFGCGSVLGAGGMKHAWRLPYGLILQLLWLYPALLLIRAAVLAMEFATRGRPAPVWPAAEQPAPPRLPRATTPSAQALEAQGRVAELELEVARQAEEIADLRRRAAAAPAGGGGRGAGCGE